MMLKESQTKPLMLANFAKKHGLACVLMLLPSLSQAETLQQLLSSALLDHPAIQAQRSQKEASEAGVESANWQFYPTPSIAVQNTYSSASDRAYQGDFAAATLGLQQPLWTGGRLTAGLKKAEAGVISSNAALEEARWQIALQVVQSYGDWLAAYLKTQVYDNSMATYVHMRELVKRRVEQGVSAESDLVLVVSRLESVAADSAVANAQKSTALARLEQLLGRRVDSATLSATVAAPRQVNADLQTLLDQALSVNPTIQRAKAQTTVQEAVVAERRADLSPQVYVRAEQQFGNVSFANAGADSRVFIGVTSNFGAGLSTLTNINGARAQYEAALEEVKSQSRTVNAQVIADFTLAAASEIRLVALKESQQASEEIFKSYDRQFLAGRRTWQDTMNSVRDLINIGMQVADTQSSQILSTWRLAIYTQGVTAVVEDGQ